MSESVTRVTSAGRVDSRTFIAAVSVHLLAWSGFVALWVASTSYEAVSGPLVGLALCLLAFLAGAAAIVVGRPLQPGLRGLYTAITAVVFGLAGLAELVGRLMNASDGALWGVLVVAPVVATVVFPVILGGVVVAGVPRAKTRLSVAPVLVLAGSALAVAAGFALILVPVTGLGAWVWGWPLAVATLLGLIAAMWLVAGLVGQSPAAGLGAFAGWLSVVSGSVLLFLTCAQMVFADATGIFGTLVWLLAGPLFAAGGVGLIVATYVFHRGVRSPDVASPVAA